MNVAGYLPFSLSDYPGHPAAVIFTQGCNFQCPFCHNGDLLDFRLGTISDCEIMQRLAKRRGRIDGVVISGGEPTLQSNLGPFCTAIKALGFLVKLDTNGGRPDVLTHLLSHRAVDYIAMDIKAPFEKYATLAGHEVDIAAIRKSIDIIASHGVVHHFRTTHVPSLLSDQDIDAIRRLIPPNSEYILQPFTPDTARDPALRIPYTKSQFKAIA